MNDETLQATSAAVDSPAVKPSTSEAAVPTMELPVNRPSVPRPAGTRRGSLEIAAFRRDVFDHVLHTCGKELRDASPLDLYQGFAHTVRDRLVHRWLATQRTYEELDVKRAYYLSSEFLTGRSLGLCLMNLGLYDAAELLATELGFDLTRILDSEGDPGLGNGGLGRLAACFMDSLATLQLPATGYGIRYDFGMFEQRFEDGQQLEGHDNWLQYGNAWELPRHEDAQVVRFGGRVESRLEADGRMVYDWVDARTVIGLPYDSFIVGHGTDTVNTLRLWAARATRDFDLKYFNAGDFRRAVEEKIDSENISKVLYPNDHSEEGKALRLKQQYFFVACSIADIVRRYKKRHATFDLFPEKVAIQLNDTHPAVAVAELMRVLVDQERLEWDFAWSIAERTFGYTNHTLLPEALERWPVALFERLLPRHLMIIYEINHRFLRIVQRRWPGDMGRLSRMSIFEEGPYKQVRMAHLATVGSHSVNGVARLHTDLLKSQLLADFNELWPQKFNNKTNGVTPRRWILHANPRLTRVISSRIGTEWIDRDLSQLTRIKLLADDPTFQSEVAAVKRANKADLARLVATRTGIELPENAVYVVHIKRIHEYKRQLLTALSVVAQYSYLKQNPAADFVPRAYIFAGKAAPGYTMAKLHIKLINDIAAMLNNDPVTQGKLSIVFLPNYGVSLAQTIIPAADISLQISTAGKEASGTSNMKFALNGALTIGTLDGANVEIRDEVGPENFFLFGLNADEVVSLRARGYDPRAYIAACQPLSDAMSLIASGFFSLGERDRFRPILDNLTGYDPFMVCADFEAFMNCEARAFQAYRDPRDWTRRAVFNIAGASRFSSDNTIRQYASEIWGLKPVTVDVGILADGMVPSVAPEPMGGRVAQRS
jgi:starch phosphorylase